MYVDPPKRIGNYEVLKLIHEVCGAAVYLARDPAGGQIVAIAMPPVEEARIPERREAFRHTAEAMASLDHPNIARVLRIGDHEGTPFVVSEWREGDTLATILRRRHQPGMQETLRIMIEVCHALAYTHQRGMTHGDINPENILVLKDGSVRILGFGIFQGFDASKTRIGRFPGILDYAAPEKLNGKFVDQRSDIYSTGMVLYQMLTGTLPFVGGSVLETATKIMHEPVQPLPKSLPQSDELEAIKNKALAKDPSQRYASVGEMARDLEAVSQRLRQESVDAARQDAGSLLPQIHKTGTLGKEDETRKTESEHPSGAILQREVERARQISKLIDSAKQAINARDYTLAKEVLDQSLRFDPDDPTLRELKAQIGKLQAQRAEATQANTEPSSRSSEEDTGTFVLDLGPLPHASAPSRSPATAAKPGRSGTGLPFGGDPSSAKWVQPSGPFKISIAHPRRLSKGHNSKVVVALYLDDEHKKVKERLKRDFDDGKHGEPYVQKRDTTDIEPQTRVQVELFSQAIDFSQPVILDLSKPVNYARFLAKPRDDSSVGEHQTKVVIKDCSTGAERYSGFIQIKIVDYIFDHVSRPFFSASVSGVLGAGSLLTFLLTTLGKFDKTLGVTSGAAALVLGSAIFGKGFRQYFSSRQTIPSP